MLPLFARPVVVLTAAPLYSSKSPALLASWVRALLLVVSEASATRAPVPFEVQLGAAADAGDFAAGVFEQRVALDEHLARQCRRRRATGDVQCRLLERRAVAAAIKRDRAGVVQMRRGHLVGAAQREIARADLQ